MREKIFVSVLLVIIFTSFNLTAQAYDPFYPGSYANPLQVEIVPTPSQIYQQTVRDAQQLQMQRQQEYDQHQASLEQARQNWEDASNKILSMPKIAACSYTYTSVHSKFSEMLKDNMADLFTVRQDTSNLNALYSSYQKCVNGAAQAVQTQNQVPQLTNDQICTDHYGLNATFKEIDPTDGGRICSCKTGYAWNEQKTSCVITPITPMKTNDPVQGGEGGTQSTLMCNGKTWTDCPTGQKFFCPSIGDAQCVSVSKTVPVKPITKKVPEIKTDTTNTPSLSSTDSDTKVVISTEPVKPKSLWSRFIGWLGF